MDGECQRSCTPAGCQHHLSHPVNSWHDQAFTGPHKQCVCGGGGRWTHLWASGAVPSINPTELWDVNVPRLQHDSWLLSISTSKAALGLPFSILFCLEILNYGILLPLFQVSNWQFVSPVNQPHDASLWLICQIFSVLVNYRNPDLWNQWGDKGSLIVERNGLGFKGPLTDGSTSAPTPSSPLTHKYSPVGLPRCHHHTALSCLTFGFICVIHCGRVSVFCTHEHVYLAP